MSNAMSKCANLRVGALFIGLLMSVAAVFPAAAGDKLTAIVQSVNAPSLGLTPFTLLAAGTKLKLQPGETIEIGYFQSCLTERITGGEIVINEDESWVVDGAVDRVKTECANGGPTMQGAENDAAVVVVRNSASGKPRIVAGGEPLLLAPGLKGKVTAEVRRLDAEEKPLAVELTDGLADLAGSGVALSPGGQYEIKAGGRSIKFQIADKPAAGEIDTLSRLILF